MYQKLLFVGLVAWAMCGCSAPFRCFSERIEISMPATIERNGATHNETLTGVVAFTNVPDQFPLLKAVLTEDPSRGNEGVVWSVPAFKTNGGFIAVALQAPLQVGDSLIVTSAFNGGGWGRFDLPEGSLAQVSVRADSFVAVSASGSIRILAVSPLQLRVDITTRSNDNATIRIRGDAGFRFVREPVACT